MINKCIRFEYHHCVSITVACLLRECPPGTICRICEETGEAYCEYSCAVDNGGCPEGVRCTEVEVPTCDPGQCCSHVNVTCSGNCIMHDYNVLHAYMFSTKCYVLMM